MATIKSLTFRSPSRPLAFGQTNTRGTRKSRSIREGSMAELRQTPKYSSKPQKSYRKSLQEKNWNPHNLNHIGKRGIITNRRQRESQTGISNFERRRQELFKKKREESELKQQQKEENRVAKILSNANTKYKRLNQIREGNTEGLNKREKFYKQNTRRWYNKYIPFTRKH